jgi:exodeoxyribonuclease-3
MPPRTVTVYSWNVNGIRAAAKKGLLEWLVGTSPDILCLQETKAMPDQLSEELRSPKGYQAFFSSAEKKGYSGVATYSRTKPETVRYGFEIKKFDSEGRILITEHSGFTLLNIYFPNGKKDQERLKYKMDFYDATLDHCEKLRRSGKKLVICGDVNTAHKEMDLARPKENEKTSGFLPIERAWIDKLLAHGYVDTFRQFNQGPGQYTWWDLKTGARERNVGWRIDYFFVTADLARDVVRSWIMPEVQGSDHCPIGLELKQSP